MLSLHPSCQAIRQRILAGDGPNITKQEIFDAMAQHTFQQGKPATIGDMCAYRGSNDTCCNVGAIIPDETYAREFDGAGNVYALVNNMMVKNDEQHLLQDFLRNNVDFLRRLQTCHDIRGNWNSSRDMKMAFRNASIGTNVNCDILSTLGFKDR